MNRIRSLYNDALDLLKKLISIPSFSREEHGTASALEDFSSAEN